MIGVVVEGGDRLIKDLQDYERRSKEAIQKAVDDTAKAVETDAKSRLLGMHNSQRHVVFSNLIRSIYNRGKQAMEKVVGTNVHYAPYIEFGTGDLVFTNFDFDETAKRVASQYRGKGIKKVNIRGDSFLNWAAVNQRQKLVKRIEENLNKIK